ncbi:hypothetical protein QJS10_CPB15g01222 [Acorus calamus]|uniref:Transmembrane protein n=1 Tax=Acorus calamus TaxID=4465 RepID=A0AAV9D865_ACOCL|nr:hypothetical protein QJS10_CPB15g01222 [Acorus calamus]
MLRGKGGGGTTAAGTYFMVVMGVEEVVVVVVVEEVVVVVVVVVEVDRGQGFKILIALVLYGWLCMFFFSCKVRCNFVMYVKYWFIYSYIFLNLFVCT